MKRSWIRQLLLLGILLNLLACDQVRWAKQKMRTIILGRISTEETQPESSPESTQAPAYDTEKSFRQMTATTPRQKLINLCEVTAASSRDPQLEELLQAQIRAVGPTLSTTKDELLLSACLYRLQERVGRGEKVIIDRVLTWCLLLKSENKKECYRMLSLALSRTPEVLFELLFNRYSAYPELTACPYALLVHEAITPELRREYLSNRLQGLIKLTLALSQKRPELLPWVQTCAEQLRGAGITPAEETVAPPGGP